MREPALLPTLISLTPTAEPGFCKHSPRSASLATLQSSGVYAPFGFSIEDATRSLLSSLLLSLRWFRCMDRYAGLSDLCGDCGYIFDWFIGSSGIMYVTFVYTPAPGIPEPASLTVFALGVAGASAARAWRRRR